MGCWKSSGNLFIFYFLYEKHVPPTYHSVDAAAKTTYALASFPGLKSYSSITVIINILYTKLPSEQGLGRTQQPCLTQPSQFGFSVSEMQKVSEPELWIFSTGICFPLQGLEVD